MTNDKQGLTIGVVIMKTSSFKITRIVQMIEDDSQTKEFDRIRAYITQIKQAIS